MQVTVWLVSMSSAWRQVDILKLHFPSLEHSCFEMKFISSKWMNIKVGIHNRERSIYFNIIKINSNFILFRHSSTCSLLSCYAKPRILLLIPILPTLLLVQYILPSQILHEGQTMLSMSGERHCSFLNPSFLHVKKLKLF